MSIHIVQETLIGVVVERGSVGKRGAGAIEESLDTISLVVLVLGLPLSNACLPPDWRDLKW